ncbi:tyrosine-type recombinase/integrase [Halorubrum halophilum]|uniref:tyrosine-type recombinase/integrase n=1 Tax=Halorubrum halophilum TaxID=413816 RepID=UPI00186B4AF7|nr:tyrosine-type recombinase/integrase [Halorubrum halophilum]
MNKDEISNREKELVHDEFLEFYTDLKFNRPDKKTPSNFKETFHRLQEFMDSKGLAEWGEFRDIHAKLFINWLREQGLHDTTIERHADKLTVFIRDGEPEDEADTDDREEAIIKTLKGIDFSSQSLTEKFTGEETLWVSVDHYTQILEACETTREELIIRFLWETGVRRSELAELTIQRIDRDEQVIKVDNKKNDDSRTIPYSDEIKPVLREWLDYGGRDAYKPAKNSPYLIVTQHSEQVQPAYINDIVRRVADRSGVTVVYGQDAAGRDLSFPTAHHFRHAFATHRVANGMSLEILKELMGHHSVEVTSKYVGLKDETKKEANEKYRPKTFDRDTEIIRRAL